ncbi:MAG: DUF1499 domain-containing protein [Synechococcaceae cyanobacterium]
MALPLALLLLISAPLPAQASLLHLEGPVPAELGVQGGQLAACPSPAHCARADWPLADPAVALDQLDDVLAADPAIRVVERRGPYLHATATSRIFGFVDDLELLADPDRGLLQARSVSRLGDSDLGVNARRLARLRARLSPSQSGP